VGVFDTINAKGTGNTLHCGGSGVEELLVSCGIDSVGGCTYVGWEITIFTTILMFSELGHEFTEKTFTEIVDGDLWHGSGKEHLGMLVFLV
jgi:hypothetical protein